MRLGSDLYEYKAALCGLLFCSGSVLSPSTHGATIDTFGFQDMMATLCVGIPEGTADGALNSFDVKVKFQEAVEASGPYTDITNGAIMGSVKFDTIAVLANSAPVSPGLYMDKIAEKISDQKRKRYWRVNAIAAATAAYGKAWIPVSVHVLLGRPINTIYITSPASVATNVGNNAAAIWGSHVAPHGSA